MPELQHRCDLQAGGYLTQVRVFRIWLAMLDVDWHGDSEIGLAAPDSIEQVFAEVDDCPACLRNMVWTSAAQSARLISDRDAAVAGVQGMIDNALSRLAAGEQ
jgi:hypothetical protein